MKKQFIFLVIFSLIILGYAFPLFARAETLPVCVATDWSCTDWGACHADGNYFQNRTCSKTANCEGGVASPSTQQICTPPFCTSWTYSDWGPCDPNLGYKQRTEISAFPTDCIIDYTNGPGPIDRQTCSVFPACTSGDWSCADWTACSQNNNQTRTCSKISNCQGGVVSPATSQTCTYTPTCISFGYSIWSVCSSNGTQTRSVVSTLPSSCIGGNPVLTQSCSYIKPAKSLDQQCKDYYGANYAWNDNSGKCINLVAPQSNCTADTWTCGAWGTCSPQGIQTRSCNKTYDCSSAETAVPVTTQYCQPSSSPIYQSPADTQNVTNQGSIIKATVKLKCWVTLAGGRAGSGTIIDSEGIILTNKHLITNEKGVIDVSGCHIGFINSYKDIPYFDDSGSGHFADIYKVSTNEDIVLLKLRNPNNKILPSIDISKGNNNNLKLTDELIIYGYPGIGGDTITVTKGYYNGIRENYLKTDALIAHGNSGGGAYTTNGIFMGIPTGAIPDDITHLGYVLSVNTINSWINNTPVVYSPLDINNYSRVASILENMTVDQIDKFKIYAPGTEPTSLSQDNENVVPKTIKSSTPPITNQKIEPNQIAMIFGAGTTQQASPALTKKITWYQKIWDWFMRK